MLRAPGMRPIAEAALVGMAQSGCLLLGRVGDRPQAPCESSVWRRVFARFQRVAPTPVGTAHVLKRHAGVVAHRNPPMAAM
jgi:hypothetical protein